MVKNTAKRQDITSQFQARPKALPVTLLSGFLGSGKTTLLQHILRSDHGLKIAVIVNDIGAVNVDASLIKQTYPITKTEERVIALQNGCICCTLRGDLLEELVRLSELQEFDYVIIESSGISEPEQVAETFDRRLAEKIEMMAEGGMGLHEDMLKILNKVKTAGGLDKFARLDTTVTVLDVFTVFNDFDTDDLISSRRDDVTPEDERTVSDLMVDQIEFADVIILNKIDMVDAATKTRIVDLVTKLNHRAKLIESSYGKIDVNGIVNTGMFDMEHAQTGYGWLQDLHAMTLREINGRNVVTPKPETEEYSIRNFIYTRRRPFHPQRLFHLLYDKFILQLVEPDEDEDDENDEEEEDEDEDVHVVAREDRKDDQADSDGSSPYQSASERSTVVTTPSSTDSDTNIKEAPGENNAIAMGELITPPNDTIMTNKRASPLFARLFRSKGEFYLATRPHRAGDWSQAGAMLTIAGGRPWFCMLPSEEYMTGDPEIDALVLHDVRSGGEWGDRRQEVVFIGERLDVEGLERVLDECLLTDEEFANWEGIMRGDTGLEEKMNRLADLFEDGFPDWPGDNDHEGHDHGVGRQGPACELTDNSGL